MKKGILLIVFIIASKAIFAQHDDHSHESPTVATENKSTSTVDTSLFITEPIFDFGKIPQGKPVHHNFEIKNTGKTALKILNVQASCGCTTPEWEKDKDIPSNGTSIIKVGYNAASEGLFTKVITVTYNDSQTKQITIKGEVWKTPSASAPSNSSANDLKD
jgi:hypothetical protein